MASYNDQQLFSAVQPKLQPDEQVRSVAYGTRTMPMWLQLICVLGIFAGIIPGLILFLVLHFALLKHFVVALTDRRLIIMEVSGLHPKFAWDYPLPLQGRVVSAPKSAMLRFEIQAPRAFHADFYRNSGPTNFQNAQNIVVGLQQAGQMPGAPQGYGQPQMQQMAGPPGAPQLPPGGGGYGGPPQGGGGYGPPPGGGGYGGPPQGGGGYGPPPGGGGYGPPPGGGAPGGGGGYGPPPGGGYGPPPGGGAPGGGYGGPPQGGGGGGGWGGQG